MMSLKQDHCLKNIIGKLDDQYEVYEAEDLQSGVKMIREIQPKLIFLDIEMPNEQGTEILNYFDPEEINFEIVFSTAYSDYALRAFELNAIDYLLKPIRVLTQLSLQSLRTLFLQ